LSPEEQSRKNSVSGGKAKAFKLDRGSNGQTEGSLHGPLTVWQGEQTPLAVAT
jgi:hypothetical protein